MWVKLSQENIFPGLKMCDEISVTTEDPIFMRRKIALLKEWSDGASGRIKQIAHNVRSRIYHFALSSVLTSSARNNRRFYLGWRRGSQKWQKRLN